MVATATSGSQDERQSLTHTRLLWARETLRPAQRTPRLQGSPWSLGVRCAGLSVSRAQRRRVCVSDWRSSWLPLVAVATISGVLLTSAPAQAYGPKAQWQIGLSANCNNPLVCGQDALGGFWGWAEFDSDNTGDAQLAGCNHL